MCNYPSRNNNTTTTMDFGSHPQHDRIGSWPASAHEALIPPTLSPDDDSRHSGVPKRRRTDDIDEIYPEESASQLGMETIRGLHRTDAFRSSRPTRSLSLTCETPVLLQDAWPPVSTEGLVGLKEAPPEHAVRLRNWLAEGNDFGFIP